MSTPQEQAQAHADLLMSTGMAYEITPHTIAYRAFIPPIRHAVGVVCIALVGLRTLEP